MITFGPWSSSFCFSGRASPLKLNLKLNIKLLRNNSKYNFNIISSVATKSLFPLVCCRSAQLFIYEYKITKILRNLQVFSACRAAATGAWFSSDWRKFCFRPLERLFPPIGKPKTARRAPRNYFWVLTFFNKIRAYPPTPPEGMGASIALVRLNRQTNPSSWKGEARWGWFPVRANL